MYFNDLTSLEWGRRVNMLAGTQAVAAVFNHRRPGA